MQIRKYALRFIFIFFTLIVCLIFFSIKLFFLQIFNADNFSFIAKKQHDHVIEIEPVRGGIYDRNLQPLAFNVTVYSLFANPKVMTEQDKQMAISKLSVLCQINPATLEAQLNKEKYFVWLKRKLSIELRDQINALKIKGLGFRKESKRFYPGGELAAHVMGFAGLDNEGLEGLELSYNDKLKGEPGWVRILRDAKQRELQVDNSLILPKNGYNLVLTIDETIQYITETALEKAYRKFKAKDGSVIVMDVRTGEILALANQPTYNLSHVDQSSLESRTNRAISFMYEPGSVFKIVTASAALEEGAFHEKSNIFCENGEYRVGNHLLHDHHARGMLTFEEVFQYSSNIGVTKIAQKLGADTIYKYAKRFRFGQKTGIELRGEVAGILKPPSVWSKTSIGAIPIGQEVTVTPLQLISALSAIANEGIYMKPFVVKYIKDQQDQIIEEHAPTVLSRVILPETARRVRDILTLVVEKGTGTKARIKGMAVAGKTGTAQKVIGGRYSHDRFYATFMGFAPADDPRIAVIVVMDEPYPYFGGVACAPAFKEIMSNTLKYLESINNK